MIIIHGANSYFVQDVEGGNGRVRALMARPGRRRPEQFRTRPPVEVLPCRRAVEHPDREHRNHIRLVDVADVDGQRVGFVLLLSDVFVVGDAPAAPAVIELADAAPGVAPSGVLASDHLHGLPPVIRPDRTVAPTDGAVALGQYPRRSADLQPDCSAMA